MLAAAAADLPLPVGRLALVSGHHFPVKTSYVSIKRQTILFQCSLEARVSLHAYAYLDDSSGSGLLVQRMNNFKNQ